MARRKRPPSIPLVHPAQRGADLNLPKPSEGPTPSKMSLMQAQLDGERSGRAAAYHLSSLDLEVNEADVDNDTGSVDMCDQIVKEAWGQRHSSYYQNPWPEPASTGPLHEAFKAGFTHAVKQKFACVCYPGEDEELAGLRRGRRRGRR